MSALPGASLYILFPGFGPHRSHITSSATFSGVQWSDRHQRGELFLRFGHLNSELIVSWVLALELERGGLRANSKSIWSPPASNMFPVPSGGVPEIAGTL